MYLCPAAVAGIGHIDGLRTGACVVARLVIVTTHLTRWRQQSLPVRNQAAASPRTVADLGCCGRLRTTRHILAEVVIVTTRAQLCNAGTIPQTRIEWRPRAIAIADVSDTNRLMIDARAVSRVVIVTTLPLLAGASTIIRAQIEL